MSSVRVFLLLLIGCGGKNADPVVVPPTAPAASHSSSMKTPTNEPVPTPPPAPASRCPSEEVRRAVLDCPATASGPVPTYVDVLDALSRENNEQMKSRRAPPPKAKSFAPRALTPLQQNVIDISKTYRCFGKGDPSQKDQAAYELSRTFFESQHWEEAIAAFHVVAMERSAASEYAAQLALEAMNILGAGLKRADCNEELGPRATLYRQHLCGSPQIAGNETCETLTKIEAEVAKTKKP